MVLFQTSLAGKRYLRQPLVSWVGYAEPREENLLLAPPEDLHLNCCSVELKAVLVCFKLMSLKSMLF